jgi:hypothetical protein
VTEELPKRRRRSRGPSPLVAVPLFIYPHADIYQRVVDVIGMPGIRPGQQVELRHHICAGRMRAAEIVEEWVDDLNKLNPTTADRQRKRGFHEPPLPIEEHPDPGKAPESAKYRVYFNPLIPEEKDVIFFVEQRVLDLTADYARQRLHRKLRQMYLRLALIEGLKATKRLV